MTELKPEGSTGIASLKLARMIALSAQFQKFTVTHDYKQAREFVFHQNVYGKQKPPFAVVSQNGEHVLSLIAGGDKNYFRASGALFLMFVINTPKEYYSDNVLGEIYADNFFTKTIEEVSELANADDPVVADRVAEDEGHLDIRRFNRILISENKEQHWESIGRFWLGHYVIEWGGDE